MIALRSAPFLPPPRGLPAPASTKGRLLAVLKRRGGGTVDDLAAALGLAAMTVRQHLAALERDELVRAEEVRGGPGRPRHRYRLTELGEEAFPRRYDRLAAALLREVGELSGAEIAALSPPARRELLLTRLAEREAARHLPRFAGRPLRERVALAVELLQADGGLAEWERVPGGYVLADYTCTVRRVAPDADRCVWHAALLPRLLGCPVQEEPPANGAVSCCRFVIADTPDAARV
jgi:DeoR family suf operon transcriptional repressor